MLQGVDARGCNVDILVQVEDGIDAGLDARPTGHEVEPRVLRLDCHRLCCRAEQAAAGEGHGIGAGRDGNLVTAAVHGGGDEGRAVFPAGLHGHAAESFPGCIEQVPVEIIIRHAGQELTRARFGKILGGHDGVEVGAIEGEFAGQYADANFPEIAVRQVLAVARTNEEVLVLVGKEPDHVGRFGCPT